MENKELNNDVLKEVSGGNVIKGEIDRPKFNVGDEVLYGNNKVPVIIDSISKNKEKHGFAFFYRMHYKYVVHFVALNKNKTPFEVYENNLFNK